MAIITEGRSRIGPIMLTGALSWMGSHIAAYRRSRNTLRDLQAMEDYMLRDIGLTRTDVVRASLAEAGSDRMAMLSRARDRRIR